MDTRFDASSEPLNSDGRPFASFARQLVALAKAHTGISGMQSSYHPLFADMLGSNEAALVLFKMIQWTELRLNTSPTSGGWFYHKHDQWYADLRITEFQLKRFLTGKGTTGKTQYLTLTDIGVEMRLAPLCYGGMKTTYKVSHYRVNFQRLLDATLDYIRQNHIQPPKSKTKHIPPGHLEPLSDVAASDEPMVSVEEMELLNDIGFEDAHSAASAAYLMQHRALTTLTATVNDLPHPSRLLGNPPSPNRRGEDGQEGVPPLHMERGAEGEVSNYGVPLQETTPYTPQSLGGIPPQSLMGDAPESLAETAPKSHGDDIYKESKESSQSEKENRIESTQNPAHPPEREKDLGTIWFRRVVSDLNATSPRPFELTLKRMGIPGEACAMYGWYFRDTTVVPSEETILEREKTIDEMRRRLPALKARLGVEPTRDDSGVRMLMAWMVRGRGFKWDDKFEITVRTLFNLFPSYRPETLYELTEALRTSAAKQWTYILAAAKQKLDAQTKRLQDEALLARQTDVAPSPAPSENLINALYRVPEDGLDDAADSEIRFTPPEAPKRFDPPPMTPPPAGLTEADVVDYDLARREVNELRRRRASAYVEVFPTLVEMFEYRAWNEALCEWAAEQMRNDRPITLMQIYERVYRPSFPRKVNGKVNAHSVTLSGRR